MDRRVNGLADPNQQAFTVFYATYAPKLWGIILLANLPDSQSETILIKTLTKAWQQLGQNINPIKLTFTWLLTVAYSEGLPKLTPILMNSAHYHSRQTVSVLIAGGNQDDQALLSQSLKTSMPRIETAFTSTAEQTLRYLQASSPKSDKFPRLLLLTIEGSNSPTDWQLLQQIKATNRQLPIVVISTDQQDDLALQAYDLGINSFLVKSVDLDEWKHKLASLAAYWLTIVTLPNQQIS